MRRKNAKKSRDAATRLLLSKITETLSEEQTILSRERTIQSFMQTGIASIGVGLVVINVFRDSFGFMVLGGFLVVIGLAEVLESLRRLKIQKGLMKRVKTKERKMNIFR